MERSQTTLDMAHKLTTPVMLGMNLWETDTAPVNVVVGLGWPLNVSLTNKSHYRVPYVSTHALSVICKIFNSAQERITTGN